MGKYKESIIVKHYYTNQYINATSIKYYLLDSNEKVKITKIF